jgi:CubicO group peptidase (beta-lactamase class C family)
MQRLRSHRRIAPVCVALGVISGCSGSAFGQAVTRAQVEARLPALEALAQQAIDAGDVPGLAIAIVYGDETLFLKGFGRREIGKPDLVGPETVFQIAPCPSP